MTKTEARSEVRRRAYYGQPVDYFTAAMNGMRICQAEHTAKKRIVPVKPGKPQWSE